MLSVSYVNTQAENVEQKKNDFFDKQFNNFKSIQPNDSMTVVMEDLQSCVIFSKLLQKIYTKA